MIPAHHYTICGQGDDKKLEAKLEIAVDIQILDPGDIACCRLELHPGDVVGSMEAWRAPSREGLCCGSPSPWTAESHCHQGSMSAVGTWEP